MRVVEPIIHSYTSGDGFRTLSASPDPGNRMWDIMIYYGEEEDETLKNSLPMGLYAPERRLRLLLTLGPSNFPEWVAEQLRRREEEGQIVQARFIDSNIFLCLLAGGALLTTSGLGSLLGLILGKGFNALPLRPKVSGLHASAGGGTLGFLFGALFVFMAWVFGETIDENSPDY